MTKRIAIIGAGPIGVETAALAIQRGHDVTVYEQGAVGANVARWSHVDFFSPWEMNRSEWGAAILEEAGLELADAEAFPNGAEYLGGYLRPLVEATGLTSNIRNLTTVQSVTRRDAFKPNLVGKRDQAGPFVVFAMGPDGPTVDEFDVVFDATGVYGFPAPFGRGGALAVGELELAGQVERRIPDIVDRDREFYAGKTTLLVGQGYSAITTLAGLIKLRRKHPETSVLWVVRDTPPYAVMDDDPLPQRKALGVLGNRAAAGEIDGVECISDSISAVQSNGDNLSVTFTDQGHRTVDRIVSNVGYRPNLELTRELQVHHCYASEGIMKLAATLIDGADCLAQEAPGIDTLRNPEPDFWVIGNKSYGRNSSFLLRVGFEQIEAIMAEYA